MPRTKLLFAIDRDTERHNTCTTRRGSLKLPKRNMQESITSVKMKQKGTLSYRDALVHCIIDTLVWLTGPVIDDGIVPA